MKSIFRPALSLFILLSMISGLIYPFAITAIAQGVFPKQAAGSLIFVNKKLIGSELIGQNFSDPKYFWGRLSATSPQPYNASASSGSNLGPLNPALLDTIKVRIDALHAADPDNDARVPVDLVTASGSGLDPHISPAAAAYQAGRIAKVRRIDKSKIEALIAQNTEGRQFGVFGEPRINVLKLNLALDRLH